MKVKVQNSTTVTVDIPRYIKVDYQYPFDGDIGHLTFESENLGIIQKFLGDLLKDIPYNVKEETHELESSLG